MPVGRYQSSLEHRRLAKAAINPGNAVVVGANSTPIFLENKERMGARFVNDSDEDFYVKMGAAAVMHEGDLVSPGDAWETNQDDLYTGAVNAICASGGKVGLRSEW